MTILNAHFDGRVLVPDEPVELEAGQKYRLRLEPVEEVAEELPPLLKLARELEKIPASDDLPTDFAAQYEHYLYGTPKQP
jgi:hypothetical protein